MKTLLFAQHNHLGVIFEAQSSIWINTWYTWVILLTLEYAVHVILIPLNVQKLSPLEYRNPYSFNKPYTREAILVQLSHNLYVQKNIRIPIYLYATPSSYDLYDQQLSEILFN